VNGDQDLQVRRQVAWTLPHVAKLRLAELLAALKHSSAYVRKGAAAALERVRPLPTDAAIALKALAENEREDLQVRRVAASVLERAGSDMREFFTRNTLIGHANALCPDIPMGEGIEDFQFDIYTGECMDAGYSGNKSGGSRLFDVIRGLFGRR
jgi:HEAT repeat protein